MEGVYRVNGGQLTMKKLRTSFDQGKLYFTHIFFIAKCWSYFFLVSNSVLWTLGHSVCAYMKLLISFLRCPERVANFG